MKTKSLFTRSQALKFARLCVDGSIDDIIRGADKIARKMPANSYWRRDFVRLANILRAIKFTGRAQNCFPVFTLDGNTKLPFASFSTLPIVSCPGAGNCVEWCYSLKSWQYTGAFMRQAQNTLLLRFDRRTIIGAWQGLDSGLTVRLYVDGDFDSESTAIFWFNLMRQRPDLDCYGYSKSLEIIDRLSSMVPANYTLNLSSGSRYDNNDDLINRLLALPFVRGRFVAVEISGDDIPRGSERYDSAEYHRQVRESALSSGFGKVFSCPGRCGQCTGKGHACGTRTDSGHLVKLTIAIGVH